MNIGKLNIILADHILWLSDVLNQVDKTCDILNTINIIILFRIHSG